MQNHPTAILLDTISIQQYVFGSNKLKENLGASFNIEHLLFHEIFKLTGITTPNSLWNGITPITDNEIKVGFIGGGNALLFAKNKESAESFIKTFSLNALRYFPGLPIIYGIYENFDLAESEYQNSFNLLIANLVINKNNYRSNNIISKSPINAECIYTGQVATEKNEQNDIIGQTAKSRLMYNADIEKEHAKLLPINNIIYKFPNELNKLGQADEKSYLAVVHIDGNGFGEAFKKCKTLQDSQDLSKTVSDIGTDTFKKLINYIITEIDNKHLKYLKLKKEDKIFLPIRPILIGGDDITFVCEGKLGIHLAEKFIEIFTTNKIKGIEKITACAGIAIAKTTFPFFKTYNLAEELCQAAKIKAKENTTNIEEYKSVIEYHCAPYGISGNWQTIRNQYYAKLNKTTDDDLHTGPYDINAAYDGLNELKLGAKHFSEGINFPKNKIQELKSLLIRNSDSENEKFILKIKSNDWKLPSKNKEIEDKFFDMIELIDIYPTELIK